ncbi:MAG: hypothetical protein HUK24_05145, partial [Sphaerochaetaceae bacterium]|nr:hypothetical protein [Sphaerochaetaceae bacterium]
YKEASNTVNFDVATYTSTTIEAGDSINLSKSFHGPDSSGYTAFTWSLNGSKKSTFTIDFEITKFVYKKSKKVGGGSTYYIAGAEISFVPSSTNVVVTNTGWDDTNYSSASTETKTDSKNSNGSSNDQTTYRKISAKVDSTACTDNYWYADGTVNVKITEVPDTSGTYESNVKIGVTTP